jgi:predicted RNA-binding protein Jag
LKDTPGVRTESAGAGEERHVVVQPAQNEPQEKR